MNALAASYLAYISHYRAEEEVLNQADAGERRFGGPGPVRATAIVACLPAFTDPSGHSSGAPCSGPLCSNAETPYTAAFQPLCQARSACSGLRNTSVTMPCSTPLRAPQVSPGTPGALESLRRERQQGHHDASSDNKLLGGFDRGVDTHGMEPNWHQAEEGSRVIMLKP